MDPLVPVGGPPEEVRAILADGYAWDAKPLQSVGYAEVVAHARGELPAEVFAPLDS